MSLFFPESKNHPRRDLAPSVAAFASLVIVVVAVFVSPIVSRDYWGWGLQGLALSMLVGWMVVALANLLDKRRRPWLVAWLAVGPWALGLGGMAYLGFLLLPLEVIATEFVLRRVYRGTRFTKRRAFGLALLARSLALLPLAF